MLGDMDNVHYALSVVSSLSLAWFAPLHDPWRLRDNTASHRNLFFFHIFSDAYKCSALCAQFYKGPPRWVKETTDLV